MELTLAEKEFLTDLLNRPINKYKGQGNAVRPTISVYESIIKKDKGSKVVWIM